MISVPTLALSGSEELCRTGHFESRVVGNWVIACLPWEWKRKSCFTNGNSKEQNSGGWSCFCMITAGWGQVLDSCSPVLLYRTWSLSGVGNVSWKRKAGSKWTRFLHLNRMNNPEKDVHHPAQQKHSPAAAFSEWGRTLSTESNNEGGGMCPRCRQHQNITLLCYQKSTINNHPVNHFHSLSAQSTAKSTFQNLFCSN